ncbi:MAG: OmpH family outer membrane protein [Longimonas sp.]|uniref:OmpH family outer membrane protein n=1 Tax=Longimonas sp. TaxID=2039626 RepID=UPI00336361AF
MFNRYSVIALALILAAAWGTADVQAQQRIGFTNQEAVLANMPGIQDVQESLQQETVRLQGNLQEMQQEFQEQLQRYEQQQGLLSDERRQEREDELRQMQVELQRSQQEAEQELAQREMELMRPLLEELQDAINEVAAEQNLDLVLREQALLYVSGTTNDVVNITLDVATRLGIDIDESEVEPGPSLETDPMGGGTN